MSAIETAVAELSAAIDNANARFQNVGNFEAKLAEERAKYDELVSAEASEDVDQEAQLTEARQATDAALAEIQGAASVLSALTTRVHNLGTVASQDTPEAIGNAATGSTTEEAPAVEEPVAAPAETTTPADAEPTPEPTPAEAPVDTPAPTVDDNTPGNASPTPASGV